MNTTTDSVSIVLPSRMQVRDLLALGDQLHARYVAVGPTPRKGAAPPPAGCPAGVAIPSIVAASQGRFTAALTVLRGVDAQRHGNTDTATTDTEQKTTRVASDTAWQTFNGWLDGWARRDEDGQSPTAAEALALRGRMFPDPIGRRFIAWRSRRRWTSMQVRMDILSDGDVSALIVALGGERFLVSLRATHKAYGRAFGYTVAKGERQAGAVVMSPQFTAAKEALRDYVMKVTGSADRSVDRSEALAAWLLGPFHAMLAEFAATPVVRTKPAPATTPPAATA